MTASPLEPIAWERIVADVADALIFIDTQGVIRVWNARCEALFGFSAGEALGQSVDLIIPEHLRSAHWHAFEQAMARGATRHGAEVRTTRATHQDGRRLYVDMTFSVVRDAAGHALGSAAMARDATERYLAERARAFEAHRFHIDRRALAERLPEAEARADVLARRVYAASMAAQGGWGA